MDINFYFVQSDYIHFLKDYEISHRGFTCVPNTEYASREKFLFGAVFESNGTQYFVPVSSQIKNRDNNIVITAGKNNTKKLGSLRFAYMIPVPNRCLIPLRINDVPEENRRQRIRGELAFCRRNIHKIKMQAQKTFTTVINSKNIKLKNNSCDFSLLEAAYEEYCHIHNIESGEK
ncbi:MAG: type III toxin-antitoxin system ToxN/AbiQ family toxin [Acutalibacteraceae bacterium]